VSRNSEDEVEGDDLEDNMENDYEARPELDNYEAQGMDDIIQQNELSMEGRIEVDRRLD
jgi:hypothetical protein